MNSLLHNWTGQVLWGFATCFQLYYSELKCWTYIFFPASVNQFKKKKKNPPGLEKLVRFDVCVAPPGDHSLSTQFPPLFCMVIKGSGYTLHSQVWSAFLWEFQPLRLALAENHLNFHWHKTQIIRISIFFLSNQAFKIIPYLTRGSKREIPYCTCKS